MSKRGRFFFAAVCGMLAALAFGCGRKPPAVRPPIPEAGELAAALEGRAVPISAEGRIRAEGTALAYAECRLLVDPAAGLRMDIDSPFMTPLASIVVTPGKAQVLDLRENVLVRGAPSDVLARTLGLAVDPTPLIRILGGGLPSSRSGWSLVAPGKDEPASAVVLKTKDEQGGILRAVFESERLCLTSFSHFPDDNPVSKRTAYIVCADHADGKVPVPRRIEVHSPTAGRTLIIRLQDVKIGVRPTAGDLEIKAKPGIEEIDLETPDRDGETP